MQLECPLISSWIQPSPESIDMWYVMRWLCQFWRHFWLCLWAMNLATCKGTSVHFLTSPCSSYSYSCWYVFPMVPVHIWPPWYHIDLLETLDTPCWYIDLWLPSQVCCQRHWCFASTIAHIGIDPHDPMAHSNGQWTSIFGRLGTRRLVIVVLTISSLVRPSQGSLECSPWISLG
jgi:hypothetical protein